MVKTTRAPWFDFVHPDNYSESFLSRHGSLWNAKQASSFDNNNPQSVNKTDAIYRKNKN